jgi:peptidoglycan/LPS O-acetylase OafA/YrhL
VLNSFGVVVPYVSQSWSVGVEEQFYLIWTVLMKFFKNKLFVLFSVIIIYQVMGHLWTPIYNRLHWEKIKIVQQFWAGFTISSMAMGGLFAYLLNKQYIYKLLLNEINFYIALISVILLVSFSVHISLLVYAFLFGVIIINLAANNNIKNVLENRILNYLGKISYGLYMYHVIAIVLCIRIFATLGFLKYHLLLLCAVTLTTILFAGFSYKFMESKFIKMKTKFSKVISGDNAKSIN